MIILTPQSATLGKASSRFELFVTRCVRFVIHYIGSYLQAQVADKFPDVDDYCGHWPVTDLMKMSLKATSSRHRKLLEKMTAGKISEQDMGVRLKSKKSKKVARTKSKVIILIYIDPPLTACTRPPRSSNSIHCSTVHEGAG